MQSKMKAVKTYLIIASIFIVTIIMYQYNENQNNTNRWILLKGTADGRHIKTQTDPSLGSLPPLYIITPTYRRCEQFPEITRLSHTLMLVPNVHWLVIEESHNKTQLIADFLLKSGLSYSHLLAPMPEKYNLFPKPVGVPQRNKGLEWVRENARSGVLYFADDDNTYDLDLFEEIRYTKRVSMFPVGLVTQLGVSSPIVKDGEFAGFYDGWMGGRKFPVDMAGFAVSVEFLMERPQAIMPFNLGFQEDGFLKSLAPFEPEEIELLATNCTKILVWHTTTVENAPAAAVDESKFSNTNIINLKEQLV